MLKRWLKALITPTENSLPHFEKSGIVSYHVLFLGRVQGVGFRIEIYQMALKLDICGWVRNLQDGSVEAVLQGEKNKVKYLLEHMQHLKRADVKELKIKQREVTKLMTEFKIR